MKLFFFSSAFLAKRMVCVALFAAFAATATAQFPNLEIGGPVFTKIPGQPSGGAKKYYLQFDVTNAHETNDMVEITSIAVEHMTKDWTRIQGDGGVYSIDWLLKQKTGDFMQKIGFDDAFRTPQLPTFIDYKLKGNQLNIMMYVKVNGKKYDKNFVIPAPSF